MPALAAAVMKKIAILSTPRSGTQYLTAALRFCDVMVGHEKIDDDGIVCGFWAWADVTDGNMPCAQKAIRRFDPRTQFEHVFHLYRDPLKSLRSMTQVLKGQIYRSWIEDRIGISGAHHIHPDIDEAYMKANGQSLSLFMMCFRYWVATHERLLSLDLPKLNIDNINHDWIKIADCLSLERELPVGLHTGEFPRERLRHEILWDELERLDYDLAQRAKAIRDNSLRDNSYLLL
jgi:hypothetical protein